MSYRRSGAVPGHFLSVPKCSKYLVGAIVGIAVVGEPVGEPVVGELVGVPVIAASV